MMKTIFSITALIALLVVSPGLCFADWVIGPVTKEQAKELGMEIRAKTNGSTGVSMELEIKTESGLKNFGSAQRERVELQLRDRGTCLASATLKEDRSKPGRVVVGFEADRAHLDKLLLRVWISQGLGGEIRELRVKDFVELAQRRDDYPDEISQQLFDTYLARRGKINVSTFRAAAHIVAERGRMIGFWKTILAELQKGDENSEVGCVYVLGKMLAVDAHARDVMRREKETGEIGQWRPSVCLGPEVVQELVRRGQQTERSRVDQYAIALARARVAEATEFFRMILRSP